MLKIKKTQQSSHKINIPKRFNIQQKKIDPLQQSLCYLNKILPLPKKSVYKRQISIQQERQSDQTHKDFAKNKNKQQKIQQQFVSSNYIKIQSDDLAKYGNIIEKMIHHMPINQKVINKYGLEQQKDSSQRQTVKLQKISEKKVRFCRKSCGQYSHKQLKNHKNQQPSVKKSNTNYYSPSHKYVTDGQHHQSVKKYLYQDDCTQCHTKHKQQLVIKQEMINNLQNQILILKSDNMKLTQSLKCKEDFINSLKSEIQLINDNSLENYEKQSDLNDLTFNDSFSCVDFIADINAQIQQIKLDSDGIYVSQDNCTPHCQERAKNLQEHIGLLNQQIFRLKKQLDSIKTRQYCIQIKKRSELCCLDKKWHQKYEKLLMNYKELKNKYLKTENQRNISKNKQPVSKSPENLQQYFDLTLSLLQIQ